MWISRHGRGHKQLRLPALLDRQVLQRVRPVRGLRRRHLLNGPWRALVGRVPPVHRGLLRDRHGRHRVHGVRRRHLSHRPGPDQRQPVPRVRRRHLLDLPECAQQFVMHPLCCRHVPDRHRPQHQRRLPRLRRGHLRDRHGPRRQRLLRYLRGRHLLQRHGHAHVRGLRFSLSCRRLQHGLWPHRLHHMPHLPHWRLQQRGRLLRLRSLSRPDLVQLHWRDSLQALPRQRRLSPRRHSLQGQRGLLRPRRQPDRVLPVQPLEPDPGRFGAHRRPRKHRERHRRQHDRLAHLAGRQRRHVRGLPVPARRAVRLWRQSAHAVPVPPAVHGLHELLHLPLVLPDGLFTKPAAPVLRERAL